jgi:hypothetical protein
MKFAIVENKIVVNVAEADEAFGLAQGWIDVDNNPNVVIGATYINGVFTKVRDLKSEWAAVRQTRNTALTKSDVMVLPDRWSSLTDTQKTEWSAYRQALRDLPNSLQDPNDMWNIWPDEPSK